ncbi:hypothetical protein [Myxococcus sp. AB025B]|uniref:hypothetical protein n=1 Tax=Myxococcus TaxID=32 RepID=UPI001141CCD0|nr:hypothetical protein [Myxococcus sp. AB025B]
MTSPRFQGPDWTAALHHLEHGPLFAFSGWPHRTLPSIAAGVYSIWRDQQLVYVGMAGRGSLVEEPSSTKPRGLADRLRSHASGRRSGDKFCVYVCDRLVLPTLSPEDIQQVSSGALSLDERTQAFIHAHLGYRFVQVPDGASALSLENQVKGGALSCGPPLLNPHTRRKNKGP